MLCGKKYNNSTIILRTKIHPVHQLTDLSARCVPADCKGDVHLRGTISKRDGVDYLKYDTLAVRIAVGRGSLHLDNLFGGQQTLGEQLTPQTHTDIAHTLPSHQKKIKKNYVITNQICPHF